MRLSLSCFVLLLSVNASAESMLGTYDFGAPSLPSGASLPYTFAGQIYYDVGSGQFKGIDHLNNTLTLSPPTGTSAVTSVGTSERSERIVIGAGTDVTGCTSTPCGQFNSSGPAADSWVDDVNHNSTGNYTVNLVSGYFSAKPVCTCSVNRDAAIVVACKVNSANSITVLTTTVGGSSADEPFSLVCQGQH